jgi:hypothetical protein
MIDVIIPVWNLARRGLQRVYWSVYSLQGQCEITIVNGSGEGEVKQLEEILRGMKYRHILNPLEELNLSILHNRGIRESECEWILRTDADYIFRGDFIRTMESRLDRGKFLLKQPRKLPKINITKSRVDMWKFPKCILWDKIGDGACQLTSREWFLKNPYDERMRLYGVMDNDMHSRASLELEIEWVEESEILHQWHPVTWYGNAEMQRQFEKNIIYSQENIKNATN